MDQQHRALLSRRCAIAATLAASAIFPPFSLEAQSSSRLRALVVGADSYRALGQLTRARADAVAVAKRLEECGYAVSQILDPEKAALEKAVDEFTRSIAGEHAAFIFFAGHGVQVAGENYLLAIDADPEKIETSGLSLASLMQGVARRAPRQTICVLDACRNGDAVQPGERRQRGFASVQAPDNFYVAYSAGSGQTALDRLSALDSNPNGVFTRHFAANLSPLLPFDSIIKRTRTQVALDALTVQHDQNPAIYDQTRGEIWLDAKSRAVPAIPTGPQFGHIPAAAALVVASARCHTVEESGLKSLRNPPRHARDVGEMLSSMGVAVRWLDEPSYDQLIDEAHLLARAPVATRIFYYVGHGNFSGRDGALLLPRGKDQAAPDPGYPGLWPVSLSEIDRIISVPALPEGNVLEERGVARVPYRRPESRTLYILDAQLRQMGLGSGNFLQEMMAGEGRGKRVYAPTMESGGDYRRPADIAVMYGCMPFGDIRAQYAGNPFSVALKNALSRPGLTLGQIADVVRVETEDMTNSTTMVQSPMFLATVAMRDHVLVKPSITPAATTRLRPANQLKCTPVDPFALWGERDSYRD